MKIKEITEEAIIFDNGNTITFWHEQCCCEENFADFAQLDDIARNTKFDENLDFEFVEEQGFRFGISRIGCSLFRATQYRMAITATK